MNKNLKRIGLMVAALSPLVVCSCSRENRIKLPKDYSNVFMADGRVEGFEPDPDKNKFILYVSPGALMECLPQLKNSSIDSLFAANPDWQMIIFYTGGLSDTLGIEKHLKLNGCRNVPVVFSDDNEFSTINGFEHYQIKLSEISYFIDKKNRVKGMWLVGGPSFRKQFDRINRLF